MPGEVCPKPSWYCEDAFVQVNIYGVNLNELRRKGIDIQQLLLGVGIPDCVLVEVPIVTSRTKLMTNRGTSPFIHDSVQRVRTYSYSSSYSSHSSVSEPEVKQEVSDDLDQDVARARSIDLQTGNNFREDGDVLDTSPMAISDRSFMNCSISTIHPNKSAALGENRCISLRRFSTVDSGDWKDLYPPLLPLQNTAVDSSLDVNVSSHTPSSTGCSSPSPVVEKEEEADDTLLVHSGIDYLSPTLHLPRAITVPDQRNAGIPSAKSPNNPTMPSSRSCGSAIEETLGNVTPLLTLKDDNCLGEREETVPESAQNGTIRSMEDSPGLNNLATSAAPSSVVVDVEHEHPEVGPSIQSPSALSYLSAVSNENEEEFFDCSVGENLDLDQSGERPARNASVNIGMDATLVPDVSPLKKTSKRWSNMMLSRSLPLPPPVPNNGATGRRRHRSLNLNECGSYHSCCAVPSTVSVLQESASEMCVVNGKKIGLMPNVIQVRPSVDLAAPQPSKQASDSSGASSAPITSLFDLFAVERAPSNSRADRSRTEHVDVNEPEGCVQGDKSSGDATLLQQSWSEAHLENGDQQPTTSLLGSDPLANLILVQHFAALDNHANSTPVDRPAISSLVQDNDDPDGGSTLVFPNGVGDEDSHCSGENKMRCRGRSRSTSMKRRRASSDELNSDDSSGRTPKVVKKLRNEGGASSKNVPGSSESDEGILFKCDFPGCGSEISWKPRYGKNRLLDHVRLHWQKETKLCKECNYRGRAVYSVRMHHRRNHGELPWRGVNDVETVHDMEELLTLWKTCFPDAFNYGLASRWAWDVGLTISSPRGASQQPANPNT